MPTPDNASELVVHLNAVRAHLDSVYEKKRGKPRGRLKLLEHLVGNEQAKEPKQDRETILAFYVGEANRQRKLPPSEYNSELADTAHHAREYLRTKVLVPYYLTAGKTVDPVLDLPKEPHHFRPFLNSREKWLQSLPPNSVETARGPHEEQAVMGPRQEPAEKLINEARQRDVLWDVLLESDKENGDWFWVYCTQRYKRRFKDETIAFACCLADEYDAGRELADSQYEFVWSFQGRDLADSRFCVEEVRIRVESEHPGEGRFQKLDVARDESPVASDAVVYRVKSIPNRFVNQDVEIGVRFAVRQSWSVGGVAATVTRPAYGFRVSLDYQGLGIETAKMFPFFGSAGYPRIELATEKLKRLAASIDGLVSVNSGVFFSWDRLKTKA